MKNLISNWEQRIQRLHHEKEEGERYYREVNSDRTTLKFKTQQEHGAAVWEAMGRKEQNKKIAGYEALVVRKEITKFVSENRGKLEEGDFEKICEIYYDSLMYMPEYEVNIYDDRGFYLRTEEGEDYKEHKKDLQEFDPFFEEWEAIRRKRREKEEKNISPEEQKELEAILKAEREYEESRGKCLEAILKAEKELYGPENKEVATEEVKESKEAPKEEEKMEFEMGIIETRIIDFAAIQEITEAKKEEPKEEEAKEEKNKKLSKTAKEKIKREKRKVKRIQEREKELRRIEREEKKLLKEQEKIAKRLEKLAKAKLVLLAKLNKGSEGSEGGEGAAGGETEGSKGEGNESKGAEAKKVSKASRIKRNREEIKEEDKEEWKKLRRQISTKRRNITEQGFKSVLPEIANSKGEEKKVKRAINKAKKLLGKIETFEGLINSSSKFASWAPG